MNPVVDTDLGLVYVGVGNPVPQWGGEVRAGDNLYTDSVVALDLKTGSLRWHRQLVHHDIWESDLGTPLILYDARQAGGGARKAIGVMRTDGFLFLLDRKDGKPIIPIEERPTPQNARLKTAPTQPYPVGAEQFGPDCVPADAIPEGFKPLCHFQPIDFDLHNAIYPFENARNAPMAFDPGKGIFYVAGAMLPYWIHRMEDPYFWNMVPQVPGLKSSGQIAAIDSRTDRILWRKTTPYDIQYGGGFIATKSGLLFHGEPDGNFQAIDAATGDKLWQFQTGTPLFGGPASFSVKGKQYLAVMGAGGLWAFRLDGPLTPRDAPPPPRTTSAYTGRITQSDHITMAPIIEDHGLEKSAGL